MPFEEENINDSNDGDGSECDSEDDEGGDTELLKVRYKYSQEFFDKFWSTPLYQEDPGLAAYTRSTLGRIVPFSRLILTSSRSELRRPPLCSAIVDRYKYKKFLALGCKISGQVQKSERYESDASETLVKTLVTLANASGR
eukprot:scaffold68552_cov97-Cyclotella_meneghiniana.AAC.6